METTTNVICDQCNVLVINNMVCHEFGCPEAWRDSKTKCNWCGTLFLPEVKHQAFCNENCTEAYYL